MDRQDKIKILEKIRSGEKVDVRDSRVYILNKGEVYYYQGTEKITVSVETLKKSMIRPETDWLIQIIHDKKTDPSVKVMEQIGDKIVPHRQLNVTDEELASELAKDIQPGKVIESDSDETAKEFSDLIDHCKNNE